GSEGFILDLRNNGGGLVEAGIDIARLFTDEGLIIHEQFKGEEIKSYTNPEKGIYFNLPLTVLINQNTASAAEIAAGVLQSQKRALLIGTQSYGKNSIQYIFELIDGSSIHVTSGRWWIPDLTFPLQPDILLQDDPNGTLAPLIAIDVLTK
ncbi:MAG: S41 family peptidase, partial [Chloroflexota bacterium]